MVFPRFSHGLPMFSHGLPTVFLWFSYVFPRFSHGFPMFSHGFPMFSHGFPMVSPQETFVSSHESSSPELRGEALLRDSTLRLLHRSKKESERERETQREREGAICFNCSLRFCDRAALEPTSGPKRIFLSSWFEPGVSWYRNIDSQRDMRRSHPFYGCHSEVLWVHLLDDHREAIQKCRDSQK